jgi:hypothetical protein
MLLSYSDQIPTESGREQGGTKREKQSKQKKKKKKRNENNNTQKIFGGKFFPETRLDLQSSSSPIYSSTPNLSLFALRTFFCRFRSSVLVLI